MTQSIDVTLDPNTGMLLIDCPFGMNLIVKSMPVRKWNPRKKLWIAPCNWRNIKFMQSASAFSFDGNVQKIITEVLLSRSEPSSLFPKNSPKVYDPFVFQMEALDASHGRPFAFFMDMGTGKSKVSIDRMTAYYNAGKIDRVMVICLKSVRQVWITELKKHSAIDYSIHLSGTEAQYRKWMGNEFKGIRWFVMGVETFSQGSIWGLSAEFVTSGKSGFLIDEAHTIANSATMRHKRCCEISEVCVRESRSILTGTPITKGPENFFGLFKMLDPEILGFPDNYSFQSRYVIKGGFENKQIVAYQNLEEMYDLIRPYVYQITKAEALPNLPPKLYEERVLDMTKEQSKLYTSMKKHEFYETSDGEMSTDMILTKMLRLQQISNGYVAVYPEGDMDRDVVLTPIPGKNPKLEELLKICDETTDKIIVWCIYRRELSDISNSLESKYGDGCVRMYHGTDKNFTEDHRIQAVKDFQKEDGPRFFVSTVQSGSLGLTLTAANTTIYFSNTFSMIDRTQSEDRNHRTGQHNAVTYVDLVTKGSIDAYVLKALKEKISIAGVIRQAIKNNAPF